MVRGPQILVLILFASFINYLDRSSVPFAILHIQRDFPISDQQFGFIASAFGFGYLAMMFFVGVFVDKFGSIKVWAVSALCWSLIIAVTGFVNSFAELLVFRFLLGMAEACHFPALIKTIADWIDPELRVRSIAIGVLGVPLAFILGGPFLTSLIETYGWRGMFFILGAFGFLWSVVWIFCFFGKKNPEMNDTSLLVDRKTEIPWKTFFTSPFFLSNCAVAFGFGYVFFFILTWLPMYLEIAHQFNLEETGMIVIYPWLAGGVIAILIGVLSDILHKRSFSLRISRTSLTIVCLLVASICFFIVSRNLSLKSDLICLSVGFGFLFSLLPLVHAINADLFKVHVGTAQGIMMCFVALAAVLSPTIAGHLIQQSGQFQSMLLSASVFPFVAALIAFFFQREKKVHG